jgi:hypothetical protein
MAKNNPTGTVTIEKAWLRELKKRNRRLLAQTNQAFSNSIFITNAIGGGDSFLAQLNIFLIEYLGAPAPNNWQNRYQELSYDMGNEKAMIGMYPPNIRPPTQMSQLDADTLKGLKNRSYNAQDKWVKETLSQVGIIIELQGVDEKALSQIQKEIAERIHVLESRGAVIAQTETIQANQLASINAIARENERLNQRIAAMFTDKEAKIIIEGDIDKLFDELEGLESPFERQSARKRLKSFEVSQLVVGGFKLRWISRNDSKVRELHRRFHGRVMNPSTAERNVKISPWNCRCALVALNSRDDTPKNNKQFTAQRKRLLDE